MFVELMAQIPALRGPRINEGKFSVTVEADHARYLVALMIERMRGSETYEQWLAKNAGENPSKALLKKATDWPQAELHP